MATGNNVTLAGGTGSIVLKDFEASTFRVNGDTYAIGDDNNKLTKQ